MTPEDDSDPRPGWTAWSLLLLAAVMLTVAGMFYQLVPLMRWPAAPGWFGGP
jgi:hypothetical protein